MPFYFKNIFLHYATLLLIFNFSCPTLSKIRHPSGRVNNKKTNKELYVLFFSHSLFRRLKAERIVFKISSCFVYLDLDCFDAHFFISIQSKTYGALYGSLINALHIYLYINDFMKYIFFQTDIYFFKKNKHILENLYINKSIYKRHKLTLFFCFPPIFQMTHARAFCFSLSS